MQDLHYEALVPTKGYHFNDGPFVEYTGKVTPTDKSSLPEALTVTCTALIAAQIPTVVQVRIPNNCMY